MAYRKIFFWMIIGILAWYLTGLIKQNKINLEQIRGTFISFFVNNEKSEIGDDVCKIFPKEWLSSVLNKEIKKTENGGDSALATRTCKYFINDTDYLMFRLLSFDVEANKKGQQVLGRTISISEQIPMQNFVVNQAQLLIENINLIINPRLFLSISRSSQIAASESDMYGIAIQAAKGINNLQKNISITPLLGDSEVIKSFFQKISNRNPVEAISLMNPKVIGNIKNKSNWEKQFSIFESLSLKNIETYSKNEWTETKHIYKVLLNIKLKSGNAKNVIPNYGYKNGLNAKWIEVEKIKGQWYINGIASGP